MVGPGDRIKEPRISINGVALTTAQAGSVRVAVSSFLMEMADPVFAAALGPIRDGYVARLQEVTRLMVDR